MNTVHQNILTCHRCIYRSGTDCTKSTLNLSEHAEAGSCPEGFYNGQPMPLRKKLDAAAKVALSIVSPANDALIAERTAICTTCHEAEMVGGLFRRCKICRCATWAKVRNASEACPIGKWGAA